MPKKGLKIATCQFAVGSNPKRNADRIIDQIRQACRKKADLVHFPECALSGYAGVDYTSLEEVDFDLIQAQLERVKLTCKQHKVYAAVGSMRKQPRAAKAYNCLYLIDSQGRIKACYDKRFCMPGDFDYFQPGIHLEVITINGVRCGLLICFDVRFPEIYRALKAKGVQCVIQSFYNARQDGPSVHRHIMQQTFQTRAAENFFWGSMANASGRYQPYGSCFVRPDGVITAKLPINRPSVMVNTVDLGANFYDPMKGYREMAMKGRLDNAPTPGKRKK